MKYPTRALRPRFSYLNHFFALLAILCTWSACQQNPVQGFEQDGDLLFKHHLQNDGQKVQPGDRVEYQMYFRNGDSVLVSSREQMMPITLTIPEGMDDNLLIQSLTRMAVGDSLTVARERDSIKMALPDGYEEGDWVLIDIALEKILSKEAIAAEKAALITDYELEENLGYYFKKHTVNTGKKPQKEDGVTFDFDLRKGDLIVFSTVDEAPIKHVFAKDGADRTISPLLNILTKMAEGDSATILVESDSIAYQLDPQWGFQPNDLVIFDVVLRKLNDKKELKALQRKYKKEADAVAGTTRAILKKYQAGNLDVQTTESGLKYYIEQEGTGQAAQRGDLVSVNYSGHLMSGEGFDNSFERGESIQFPLGQRQVIEGWDEGIALLKTGAKAYFFIPPNLAYGAAGAPPRIPENAELLFYVELDKVLSTAEVR